MAKSLFYWHNTPIWAQLSELGFVEIRTTFQGIYIGKCICEGVVSGRRITLEMHKRTTCNDVQVSIDGNTVFVETYKRPCGIYGGKAIKGAYKRVLDLVTAP